MQEIKSKKAKPGKKVLKEDEALLCKMANTCSCSCSGADADLDGAFDLAHDADEPSCGCSCGSNHNRDSVMDFTADGS